MNYLLPIIYWIIILLVFVGVFILLFIPEDKNIFKKTNSVFGWMYNLMISLNYMKKISIFDFNFFYGKRVKVISKFTSEPQILDDFKDKVALKICLETKPKKTLNQVQSFFSSIFDQYKFLYFGLINFFPNRFTLNQNDIINELIISQIKWMIIVPEIKPDINDELEIFDKIEGKLVNNPEIGFSCLINNLLDNVNNQEVDKEIIFDWLAKNRNAFVNINPKNINLINYYDYLQRYIKSKIEIDVKKGAYDIILQNNSQSSSVNNEFNTTHNQINLTKVESSTDIRNEFNTTNNSTTVNNSHYEEVSNEEIVIIQTQLLDIESAFINGMTKELFIKNFRKIGIFDSEGNITGSITNRKYDHKKLTKFSKNAYYFMFEKMIEDNFMNPFPINLNNIERASLIKTFLDLKEIYTENNITKKGEESNKLDNTKTTIFELKIVLL